MKEKQEYKLIDVTEDNIDDWYLFCRKTKQKTDGYQKKLAWTMNRFKEGLHHVLLLVKESHNNKFAARGFIEYIPGEYNWRGISADGYMVIHCLWVVGRYKNMGFASKLIEKCIEDSKGMNGVAVVASKKKGWCAGRSIYLKNGFKKCDEEDLGFELYVNQLTNDKILPKFSTTNINPQQKEQNHIEVCVSDQCPFITDAAEIVSKVAEQFKIPIEIRSIANCKQAQTGVHPYGVFHVLLNGEPILYHYETEKKLIKIISSKVKQ